MSKKIIILLSMLAMIVIGIIWWQFGNKTEKSVIKELNNVTLGWNAWPGVLPFLVAQDKGYFTEQGLKVDLKFEESYGDLLKNVISGKNNITANLAFMDVMLANNDGADLRVVSVQDYSNGADGIVAKKEIKRISDLKGKKVAVEGGTLGDYLLLNALDKHNLNYSDIREVNMTAQEAAQAFIRGEVDAAVIYEPDYTDAVERGNGWRIYTSADEPGIIIDSIVARKEYVDTHPEQITALLKAQFKAVQFIINNPTEAYAIGAKYFKISPAEFATQIKGVKLQGQRDNVTVLSFAAGYESLYGNSRYINDFLRKIGKIKTDIDISNIIVSKFVRQINH